VFCREINCDYAASIVAVRRQRVNLLLRTVQNVSEGDQEYRCTLSLTPTLQFTVVQNHPVNLRSRDSYPIFQKAGWASVPSGHV
jgi:hypothetical protein